MGNSTWSNDQYTAYASSTSLRSLSRAETFKSRALPSLLDPKLVTVRESCDSEANPNSTPVILALDITGSMGLYAEQMAKTELPKLMTALHEDKPVTDPHIMFMGVGDVTASDSAPVQLSQFEADLRIVEQLRELYLEGGGGGNGSESYTFPWYVAANMTKIDSFTKRNQRGFLFTFGDEGVPPAITRHDLTKVFGSRAGDMPNAGTNEELLTKVSEHYNVFHIMVEEGSNLRGHRGSCHTQWTRLLGKSVLFMRDHTQLAEIVTIAMRVSNGEDLMRIIEETPRGQRRENLEYAFTNVLESLKK